MTNLYRLSSSLDALLRSADAALRVIGKGEDDHFYGAWVGGSAAEGGHPASQFKPREASAAEFNQHYAPLDGRQGEAVNGYTREEYAYINGQLRGYYEAPESVGLLSSQLTRGGIEARVASLDAAMQPLPSDVILHRGMQIEWEAEDGAATSILESGDVGEFGIEDGFLSASLSRDISQIQDGDFEVELLVPAGTPSVWAKPYSANPGEQEVILGRGLRVEIQDYQPSGGLGGKPLVVAKVSKP